MRADRGSGRWLSFGGAVGSTLALAYGEAHPRHCLGFVLRGGFLGSRREVDWFLYCMGTVFPEAFRDFLNAIPAGERDDPLRAYRHRLTDPDPAVHLPAARAWSRYESACSTLRPTGPASRLGGARAAPPLPPPGDQFSAPGSFLRQRKRG